MHAHVCIESAALDQAWMISDKPEYSRQEEEKTVQTIYVLTSHQKRV